MEKESQCQQFHEGSLGSANPKCIEEKVKFTIYAMPHGRQLPSYRAIHEVRALKDANLYP